MPGTIKDPKMNNQEENEGVAIFNGELVIYDKRDFPATRYLPSGWKLSDNTICEDMTETYNWDGIDIHKKITTFDSEGENQQGKVVRKMRDFLQAYPQKIWQGVPPNTALGDRPGRNHEKAERTKALVDEDDSTPSL